jgi:Cu+-exporting ATPase
MSEAVYTIADAHAICYHCGEDCGGSALMYDHRPFCCSGCQTVYELLENNGMECYYDLNDKPGTSQRLQKIGAKYNWLDDAESTKKLIQYCDDEVSIVTFSIPNIHCSSCIYLLENVYKIQPDISRAQVNFLRKEVKLTFKHDEI